MSDVGRVLAYKTGLALVLLELAKGILNVIHFTNFLPWQVSVWTGFHFSMFSSPLGKIKTTDSLVTMVVDMI